VKGKAEAGSLLINQFFANTVQAYTTGGGANNGVQVHYVVLSRR
jgi:hypothetical protein